MNHRPMTAIGLALGLAIGGLAQAQSTSASDPQVHQAEVAGAKSLDGQALYQAHCSGCHQPNGQGLPGAFPPLAGADYLLEDQGRAIDTVLGGMSGPITVNGQTYNAVMPPMSHLSDAEIAAILSYVYGAWGNDGDAIAAAEVASARAGGKAPTDRAAGQPHPDTPASEMSYKGAPSAVAPESAVSYIDSQGPKMTQAE
ncbi:MAG: cytochrome c, partial [Xanthomonadales bacterium]|nr:cytochrome c [Xanthomonadales bacterium]